MHLLHILLETAEPKSLVAHHQMISATAEMQTWMQQHSPRHQPPVPLLESGRKPETCWKFSVCRPIKE
jgi:hypothetical protein